MATANTAERREFVHMSFQRQNWFSGTIVASWEIVS